LIPSDQLFAFVVPLFSPFSPSSPDSLR